MQRREKFFVMHILCKVTRGVHTSEHLCELGTRFAHGELTHEQLAAEGVQMLDACYPSTVETDGIFEGWCDECTDGSHDDVTSDDTAAWVDADWLL